jgi:hypothetical protein
MAEVITGAKRITPDWLTRLLRDRGVIDRGTVTAVSVRTSRSTSVSDLVWLEVQYSANSPDSAPARLLLKVSKPSHDPEQLSKFAKNENEFYTRLAPGMVDPPLVRCYDAVYAPETGRSHILMDDLSETHLQPEWPVPPSRAHCEQAVDCLAHVHASWWEDPRLGKGIGELFSEQALEDAFHWTTQKVGQFMSFMGDRLSAERCRTLETTLPFLPRVWRRFTKNKNLTIVHGDAHHWNFLYPQDPGKGRVYLIDWALWNIRPGTNDLAYMIALSWYPERRALWEKDLLGRYHAGLVANGVAGHDWNSCWRDYRLAVTSQMFTPIGQWANKIPARVWWPNLEKAISAFQDLGCAELLAEWTGEEQNKG